VCQRFSQEEQLVCHRFNQEEQLVCQRFNQEEQLVCHRFSQEEQLVCHRFNRHRPLAALLEAAGAARVAACARKLEEGAAGGCGTATQRKVFFANRDARVWHGATENDP
jgi:hypothetical protein